MNIKEIIENHSNIKLVGSDCYSTFYDVLEKGIVPVARIQVTGESEINIKFNHYTNISHIDGILTAILEGGE